MTEQQQDPVQHVFDQIRARSEDGSANWENPIEDARWLLDYGDTRRGECVGLRTQLYESEDRASAAAGHVAGLKAELDAANKNVQYWEARHEQEMTRADATIAQQRAQLDEIRKIHVKRVSFTAEAYCQVCGEFWPCRTAVLAYTPAKEEQR